MKYNILLIYNTIQLFYFVLSSAYFFEQFSLIMSAIFKLSISLKNTSSKNTMYYLFSGAPMISPNLLILYVEDPIKSADFYKGLLGQEAVGFYWSML